MGWTLTKGLNNLRVQTNLAFPNRDKTTDGTIGDAAHQLHASGHNPDDTPGSKAAWNGDPDNDPEVRSWDIDKDFRTPGMTAQDYVDHLIRLPGLATVIRYLIYNGRIYHASNGFKPTAFSGDPHTDHIHVEGAWTQAGDNNTTFDYRLEELTMATLDDDTIQKIADRVWTGKTYPNPLNGGEATYPITFLRYGGSQAGVVNAIGAKLAPDLAALKAAVISIAGKDYVDEQALAEDLAAALLPKIPDGAEVTKETLTASLVDALVEIAASRAPAPAPAPAA